MKVVKLEVFVEIVLVEVFSKNKRKGKKSMGKEKGNYVLVGMFRFYVQIQDVVIFELLVGLNCGMWGGLSVECG